MRLNTSYKQILKIAAPIMIGSAAQNIITLTDRVFLLQVSIEDFDSVGFVSVFYLIVAAIGFGFSRGGQILIANKAGAQQHEEAGRIFHSMFLFELFLSVVMFFFMTYGCYYLFAAMIDAEGEIFAKSMEYLDTRKWGVFFSYTGVALIALYTGIARPKILMFTTLVLATVNIGLDYVLVFGHYGFPKMGIAGAGLASSIAEVVAFVVFSIYTLLDKKNRILQIFKWPQWDLNLIKRQYRISLPLIVQPLIGLGGWFLFMGLVENMGTEAQAIIYLVQMVYLILSVPIWGFAAGITTMTGGFIGHQKRQAVIPIIWKTSKLSFWITMLLTIPFIFFPHAVLVPILGEASIDLITQSQNVFYVLAGVLALFSVGGVVFSGVSGVGAAAYAMRIQFFSVVFYLVYTYVMVEYVQADIPWIWAVELFYWLLVGLWSLKFLYSKRWFGMLEEE